MRKKEHGYILIIVLVLITVLMAAAYYFGEGLFSELIIARNNKGASVAFYLAEAGVQEAIYRVQYDTSELGARNKFVNSTDGQTQFSHNLIVNGSYDVTIQNSSRGIATITSVGTYKVGALRMARREIRVGIAQSNINPYPYDGAIFTGGGAGESIADVDIWSATLNIYGGSILSNRDINLKFGSHSNVEKTVEASGNFVSQHESTLNCSCNISGEPPLCSSNPGCTPLQGVATRTMPPIDFMSYMNEAKSHVPSQYFARASDFLAMVPKNGSTTFDGVVYIDDTLDIDYNRNIIVNGVLASSGSINISKGTLTINRVGENPAGALTQKDFKVGQDGNFTGTALIYAGDRAQIDSSNTFVFDLTGGILTRRTWFSGYRVINIHFEPTVINTTLDNPVGTPVIEINHWEEEY